MRTTLFLVGFLLLTTVMAQLQENPPPDGVIYGIVIGQDGQPAKGIGLTAYPLGVAVGAVLPHTRTNDAGAYRFEKLPWWGKYTVYADDEDAGYSRVSTGYAGNTHPPEVEVTPEHREAELNVYLPPKAGFLEIHLTNRRTGAGIPAMRIAVMPVDKPVSPLFTTSCYSTHVVLIPPDKKLLLHVTSDGFREWDESVGKGKPLHCPLELG
jgi:hypothetical protein